MTRAGGLSGLALKCIAMDTMLIDHIGHTFFPQHLWLRCIGRLAFPLFAFLIAEGCAHTRDIRRYLGRMALFAALSEVPYDLLFSGRLWAPGRQNVLWTFCIAIALIWLTEWAREKGQGAHLAAVAAAVGLGLLAGKLGGTSYGGWGVWMVLLFWLCRGRPWGAPAALAGMAVLNGALIPSATVFLAGRSWPIQLLAVLALIPIGCYNGRPGRQNKWIQYGCYAFYPVHLLILALAA
jgi:hypothetical protein